MSKISISLTYEELQIIEQCIEQLNFSGKNVREVGVLVDKIKKSIKKIQNRHIEVK